MSIPAAGLLEEFPNQQNDTEVIKANANLRFSCQCLHDPQMIMSKSQRIMSKSHSLQLIGYGLAVHSRMWD